MIILGILASIMVTNVIIATHKYTVSSFTYGVLIFLTAIDTISVIVLMSPSMELVYTSSNVSLHILHLLTGITILNAMFVICLLCNRIDNPNIDTNTLTCTIAKFSMSMSTFLIYVIYGVIFTFVEGGLL